MDLVEELWENAGGSVEDDVGKMCRVLRVGGVGDGGGGGVEDGGGGGGGVEDGGGVHWDWDGVDEMGESDRMDGAEGVEQVVERMVERLERMEERLVEVCESPGVADAVRKSGGEGEGIAVRPELQEDLISLVAYMEDAVANHRKRMGAVEALERVSRVEEEVVSQLGVAKSVYASLLRHLQALRKARSSLLSSTFSPTHAAHPIHPT